MMKPEDFFNIDSPILLKIFEGCEYVWEGLTKISSFFDSMHSYNIPDDIEAGLVKSTIKFENGAIIQEGAFLNDKEIYLGTDSIIESGAYIKGPSYIDENTEVRSGAYIRGNVIIGKNCVAGHSTEIKNSILLGKSKAGHFAYIGDSILGEVNLGAGTKLANLKTNNSPIILNINGETLKPGLRKLGAILGDGVETGCNSVTSPGTLLSRNVILYPNTSARGYYPENSIIKLRQNLEIGELNNG